VSSVNKVIKNLLGAAAELTGAYSRDFRSKMIIVAFHRVNDQMATDGITCSSAKFAAFCRFFKKHFTVMSMSQQIAGARAGRDMGGTLSITFDDGYLDNYEVAAPILRKLELPATFFITTGFIDSNRVPIWDQDLPVQPGWMNWDHLRALAAQGFEIGCHTDTHIDMGTSDAGVVREELRVSKSKLHSELGIPIDLFAYPFGGPQNISDRSLEIVREAGFICCASCHGGTNQPTPDPYQLRRIGIAEWFATPHQFGIEVLMGKA
jgi:peptidoglycan/xylan/chitin deacetylase (PgdA/CDA1 family)